jgi:hypothetical protein
MNSLFLHLFLRNQAINNNWLGVLEQQDEVSSNELISFSRIINSHHIWNSRLKNYVPDSELNDKLPLDFMQKLNVSNHLETIELLENHCKENSETYTFLHELLADQAFYRGRFYEVAKNKHLFDAEMVLID